MEVSSFVDPTIKWPDIPADAVDHVSVKNETCANFRPQGVYEKYGATLLAENKQVPRDGDFDVVQVLTISGPSVAAVKLLWTEFRDGTLDPTTRLEPRAEKDRSDLHTAIALFAVIALIVGLSLRKDGSGRYFVCAAMAMTTGYVPQGCLEAFERPIFPLTTDQKNHLELQRSYHSATAELKRQERTLKQIREDGNLIENPTDRRKVALAEEKLQEQIAALQVRRQNLLTEIRQGSPRFNREITVRMAYFVLEHSRKWQERPSVVIRAGWQYAIPYFGAELEMRLERPGEFTAGMSETMLRPTLLKSEGEESAYEREFREAAVEPMEPLTPEERLVCESALAQLKIVNAKLHQALREMDEQIVEERANERNEREQSEREKEVSKREKEVMKLVKKTLKD